jgi:tetratricopeptide (TPR) repeat protein
MSTVAGSRGSGTRVKLFVVVMLLLLGVAGAVYAWWQPMQYEGKLSDASLDQLRTITSQRPNDARALYHLGWKLQRGRDKAAAYDAMMRAANLDKDSEEIWIAAAGTANDFKGTGAAFEVMDQYLKRHPESKKMRDERASLLVSLQRAADGFRGAKRYSEAVKYYHQWLAEDPNAAAAKQGLDEALKAQPAASRAAPPKPGT